MNEVKMSFRRMALYYLLLAINIIPCANIIPDSFPTRNLSAIYLLIICVCLVLYYYQRVTTTGKLSVMMKSISWLVMLLILLRDIKYGALAEIDVLARHTWYLYYVPILLIPLFLLYISILVSQKRDYQIPKGMYFLSAVTGVFILLILTNDLHQLVFRFQPHFLNWDGEYSYSRLFYAITVWQYSLYLAAIIILVIKCRITSSKKNAWIILIPFTIGALMNILLVTEKMPKLNGAHIIEFPEALIFTVAVVLECCIQLGLIPTNTDYGRLFQKFSIAAQITDKDGVAVYSSYNASPLSPEQFSMKSGERISEHTILHKMEIPGGFGFWQDDMTELDRLNDELAQAKEELMQETELIRLRNKLKENQTKVEQRTLVYDNIAKRTQRQSQLISQYAQAARTTDDLNTKNEYRSKITLLGAYIKRYANLMLLSQESGVIETGEFSLSVSEVLRYLNYCKIPSEFFSSANCTISADAALKVFEAFEILLETNLPHLRGAFVNISSDENVSFKLALESLINSLPSDMANELSAAGVLTDISSEDDVTYICFTLQKGGNAL